MNKLFSIILSLFLITQSSLAFEELLQTTPQDSQFLNFVSQLNQNSPQTSFDYKVGTTSVGLKILQNKKYIAYWYPQENVSANSEGQVVTYTLARFLHMSELVTPSDYFEFSGKPLELLIEFLKNDTEGKTEVLKQKNIADVTASARLHLTNKTAQIGAIVLKMDKFEPTEIIDWENNRFNLSHPIAKWIRASEAQPSFMKILDLPNFYPEEGQINTATEIELATELSKIMVLDILTGQWDRFSGGNLEARFENTQKDSTLGKLRFLIRDNGGANMAFGDVESIDFKKYLPVVTRFDREQVKKLILLSKLIQNDPESVRKTLKIQSSIDLLAQRLNAVLAHVDLQVQLYGEDKAFFKN